MKNQINVEITDGTQKQTIALIGEVTAQDVVAKLLALATQPDETQTIINFLERTGATISIETPDSSNISRIQFNQVSGEIGFEFDTGSLSTYPADFKGFLEALTAPSAGKLQWAYRRGEK
jgi:hypothetical protein